MFGRARKNTPKEDRKKFRKIRIILYLIKKANEIGDVATIDRKNQAYRYWACGSIGPHGIWGYKSRF